MNVLAFTANLGGDAETRFTKSGTAVTSFSAALSAGWGESRHTTWIKCSFFGKRGEAVAPYLLKGTQVAVSGEFSAREWANKEGTIKTSCEVNVNNVTLIGSKPQQGSQQAPKQAAQSPDKDQFGDFEDDIPFSNIELRTFA